MIRVPYYKSRPRDPKLVCDFFRPVLSSSPVMLDEEDVPSHSFETKLVIQLTVYTSKAVGSGKSKKKTESKAKNTKEATFTLSSDNHLEFLRCLVIKHGQNTTYKVTEQKRFSFRYLYLVSKAYATIGWF
jgi:hypothetical protein